MPLLTLDNPSAHSLSVRAKALVFEDEKSRALLERLRQVAPSSASVLVIGETGTGKEIVARHVHELSQRSERAFVAMNCGALPESLIESELFGHEKGSFTGALTTKAGWFEVASGGTLFLDEIGDLPLNMQVKLLRVLQEGEVVRVGAREPRRVDVRLIAATNVRLEEAVAAGRFRQDLYYRLNVAPLVLPPLRERPDDILPLTAYFIDYYRHRLGLEEAVELAPEAAQHLLAHTWPGNIRELENALHQALLVCRGARITVSDLRLTALPTLPAAPHVGSRARTPEALLPALNELFEAGLPNLWDSIERTVFKAAYEYCERNQVQTARLLGISRNVVRARLVDSGEIAGSARPSSPPPAPPRSERPPALRGRVRVGFQRFGLLPLLKAHGRLDAAFAARGYDLDWVEYPGGTQLVESFESSELSLGGVGEGPTVFAQAANVPFAYLAAERARPADEGLVVRRDSAIASVRELAGKKIALNRGSNAHYLLIRALEEVGLEYDDVEVAYLAPHEARRAFDDGQVDAWAIWAPHLTELTMAGSARVLRDAAGLAENPVFYIASPSFVADRPELGELFLGELCEFAQSHAPHRVPQRVDEALFSAQQAVADTFHRHKLIHRAVRVRESDSAQLCDRLGTMSFAMISPNGPVKLSSGSTTLRGSGSLGKSSSALR
ncbi:MAG: sigma 54-interacting transcriptional regulator [Polyangiaceae bacterium]